MNNNHTVWQDIKGENEALKRSGLIGWWLDLTAPPRPRGPLPIGERERLRKAELTSFSILAIFAFLIGLVSNSLAKPSTGESVLVMAIGLFIAAIFNRTGKTRVAAYLIPSLLMLAIAAAIIGAPGGLDLVILPAFDLFVIPIFLVSLIGNRNTCWFFAFIAIAFTVGTFLLLPHQHLTTAGATNFDGIQYEINTVNFWGTINRHVWLQFFAALFGWLGARSVEGAIRRADRAEEVAQLEHAYASQRQQLELGAQQLLETHVRVANGDFSARAPLSQDNILWQVAASLNNLLNRLQKTGQAEHQLQRRNDEITRVAAALDDLQAGRRPIWPALTGTAADLILERVTGRGRQQAPQPMRGRNTPQSLAGQQPYAPYPSSMSRSANTGGPFTGQQSSMPRMAGRDNRSGRPSSSSLPTMAGSNPAHSNAGGWGDFSRTGSTGPTTRGFGPPMGQAPAGQMPRTPPVPQVVSSGPLNEGDWPSLEQFGAEDTNGRATNTQQGSNSFPTPDNPWYLPLEE